MDNRLEIAGCVAKAPQTRYSPAGIPITRFPLRHESRQSEGGLSRVVRCTIGVVVTGETQQARVRQLGEGSQIRVIGFISRSGNRDDSRIELHADTIELLPGGETVQ